jgi:isopenicillin N synthase-like dioxygenase
MSESLASIPVVDLQDFISGDNKREGRFIHGVGEALRDIGFFAVKNHGVDLSLIKKAYELAENFFMLPEATKKKYEISQLKGQRGYVSFGKEHAKTSSHPDLKEFWHVGRETFNHAHAMEPYEPNLWPQEVSGFKEVMVEFYDALDLCAQQLLQACALYLEEDRHLMSNMSVNGNSILRVIHYPPVPQDTSAIRAAAHEDINFITLLCEATSSGLELLEKDGSWRAINGLNGYIIVDSGDMLQNFSNGIFKSTTHRVVNPKGDFNSRRFSMPYFCHARSKCLVNPLPSCVARQSGKKLYKDMSVGEYLHERLKEIGF